MQLDNNNNDHSKITGYCINTDPQDMEMKLEATLQPLFNTVCLKKSSYCSFVYTFFSIIKSIFNISSESIPSLDSRYYQSSHEDDSSQDNESMNTIKANDYLDRVAHYKDAKTNEIRYSEIYKDTVPFIKYMVENIATFQYSSLDELSNIIKGRYNYFCVSWSIGDIERNA
ncbi:hypothetical protein AYI70_g10031 [Smittium culicis]|uniref:Uncharacterized protein n=1 Tax=Smittium culicis TaxID=133412 RepID=A0A1R1X8F0_9FUNG|nr:hypothetical protein AYI70_g10031 [Smittium culicis]